MKVKIISKGDRLDTQVLDEEGRALNCVTAVNYRLDANSRHGEAQISLELFMIPVELEGEVDELTITAIVPKSLRLTVNDLEAAIKGYIANREYQKSS